MKELGLVLNTRELGVSEDNIDEIVSVTAILNGGYKVLTKEDIKEILLSSLDER